MSERETTRREPMSAAHLRELADAGAMAMIVVYATEPDARRGSLWTHEIQEYRSAGTRRFEARLYSRRTGLVYAVDEVTCTCDHFTREVQRVPGAVCKHARFFGALTGEERAESERRTNGRLAQLAALT